ncbi:MAG: iron-sulfur cluster repair di-iron protein [Gemmatimonadota bacterium]
MDTDTNNLAEARVGQLAAEYPATTRVFARYGIDYCCGGGRPLGEVCKKKGLDLDQVIDEVHAEIREPRDPGVNWGDAPLVDLIGHIIQTYHDPLTEELGRLETMARKVHKVHGERDPERLAELVSIVLKLRAELEDHMSKEETVLFPMIANGAGGVAASPISVMEHEHDDVASALRRLRALTDDYEAPEGACTTWRALWHGLASLEKSMQEHIHLENNILFPRALAS